MTFLGKEIIYENRILCIVFTWVQGDFFDTVKREQSKITRVHPKGYKIRGSTKKGISLITNNHFSTKENDVEITELNASDIDVMGYMI